jgi:hypothetical protein
MWRPSFISVVTRRDASISCCGNGIPRSSNSFANRPHRSRQAIGRSASSSGRRGHGSGGASVPEGDSVSR